MAFNAKSVSDSSIEDHVYEIFPNDLNPHDSVFGGRIMEIADMIAAVCAKRHSGKVCTTLMVDSLKFKSPAKRGEVLIFKASVNRAWNSSMEVGIKVMAHNYITGEIRKVVSAYFTLIALGDSNRPTKVLPIKPETDVQKMRYEKAGIRRKFRISKL